MLGFQWENIIRIDFPFRWVKFRCSIAFSSILGAGKIDITSKRGSSSLILANPNWNHLAKQFKQLCLVNITFKITNVRIGILELCIVQCCRWNCCQSRNRCRYHLYFFFCIFGTFKKKKPKKDSKRDWGLFYILVIFWVVVPLQGNMEHRKVGFYVGVRVRSEVYTLCWKMSFY